MSATTYIRKPLIAVIASLAACGAMTGIAHAEAAPQSTVSYSDLDLNSTADAQRLYKRLRAAANRVCGANDSRDLHRIAQAQACVQQSLDQAVNAVNHPAVLALHTQGNDVRIAQKTGTLEQRG